MPVDNHTARVCETITDTNKKFAWHLATYTIQWKESLLNKEIKTKIFSPNFEISGWSRPRGAYVPGLAGDSIPGGWHVQTEEKTSSN